MLSSSEKGVGTILRSFQIFRKIAPTPNSMLFPPKVVSHDMYYQKLFLIMPRKDYRQKPFATYPLHIFFTNFHH